MAQLFHFEPLVSFILMRGYSYLRVGKLPITHFPYICPYTTTRIFSPPKHHFVSE